MKSFQIEDIYNCKLHKAAFDCGSSPIQIEIRTLDRDAQK